MAFTEGRVRASAKRSHRRWLGGRAAPRAHRLGTTATGAGLSKVLGGLKRQDGCDPQAIAILDIVYDWNGSVRRTKRSRKSPVPSSSRAVSPSVRALVAPEVLVANRRLHRSFTRLL